MKIKRILKKIIRSPFFRNKYLLILTAFVSWILLFDSHNLFSRISNLRYLKKLQKDKEYYQEKIRKDSVELHELQTNKENLEKFARENYYMKKQDEEIFVIVEEE